MPQLDSNQMSAVAFDDKDNWKINSLNRQKMIYSNLYQESSRGNRACFLGRAQPKALQKIDISPSAFLLGKLGPDEPYIPSLKKSNSVPARK